MPDPDPHSFLFGGEEHTGEFEPVRMTRADRRAMEHPRRRRHRRRGRFFVLLALVIVAAVAAFVVPWVVNYFATPDYSGSGTGSVVVTVPAGASAGDIGDILKQEGVVKSSAAFTDAASGNAKSQSIQPGRYTLHQHMSGKAALAALLAPSSRIRQDDALVREGATAIDVANTVGRLCGDPVGAQRQALTSGADLGIPVTYKVGSKVPSSAEGFLYPATYTLDPDCKTSDALQKMVSRFIQQDRSSHFAATAQSVGLTPYQALTIASIIQSEAKYPEDMGKVAQVIRNRMKAGRPLQIDSTSLYGCKLSNQTHCIYSQVNTPYNSYTHAGLPPTPIDNPGAEAMSAAVHPTPGAWMYYVNKDKDGHLFFTDSAAEFEKARQACVKNNWGCG